MPRLQPLFFVANRCLKSSVSRLLEPLTHHRRCPLSLARKPNPRKVQKIGRAVSGQNLGTVFALEAPTVPALPTISLIYRLTSHWMSRQPEPVPPVKELVDAMRSLHLQRRDPSLRSVARASSVTSGTGLSAFSPQPTDNNLIRLFVEVSRIMLQGSLRESICSCTSAALWPSGGLGEDETGGHKCAAKRKTATSCARPPKKSANACGSGVEPLRVVTSRRPVLLRAGQSLVASPTPKRSFDDQFQRTLIAAVALALHRQGVKLHRTPFCLRASFSVHMSRTCTVQVPMHDTSAHEQLSIN